VARDPLGPARADRGADRDPARPSPRSSRVGRAGRRGVAGGLRDETYLVYVSPLKALSNDIRINLEAPLAGIRAELARAGPAGRRDPHLRAHRRHAAAERARAAKRPPHIVVTTPESLYCCSAPSRAAPCSRHRERDRRRDPRAAPNKRGSHLALSLERLEALCGGA
jgi:ATP-dependent Lhr-like helicase